jgi:hypothetical protein
MPDKPMPGLAGGLLGGDTTNLSPQVRALLAMRRKQNGTDNTPKVNILDDIKAANAGKRNTPLPDSTIKMAHEQWVAHLDNIGYEIVPKKKS